MKKKAFGIWIAGIVILAVAVNFVVGVLLNFIVFEKIKTPVKYVKNAHEFLYPQEIDASNENAVSTRLRIRSLLEDSHVKFDQGFLAYFVGANMSIDEAIIFSSKEGKQPFSEGTYAVVVQEVTGVLDATKNTIGLVRMSEFIKLSCASELYKELEREPFIYIRLDKYAVKNYEIVPITMVILDPQKHEIGKIDNVDIPEGFEICEAADIYLYNEPEDNEFLNADNNIYDKMKFAEHKERKVDRMVQDLTERVDYSINASEQEKTVFGVGKCTISRVNVADGYSMICVEEIGYLGTVVLYAVCAILIWTVIMYEVIYKKMKGETNEIYELS